jgi:hypothetical protein
MNKTPGKGIWGENETRNLRERVLKLVEMRQWGAGVTQIIFLDIGVFGQLFWDLDDDLQASASIAAQTSM